MRKKAPMLGFIVLLSIAASAQTHDFRQAAMAVSTQSYHSATLLTFNATPNSRTSWYWENYWAPEQANAVPEAPTLTTRTPSANMDFAPVSINFNLSSRRPLKPVINLVGFDLEPGEHDPTVPPSHESLWNRATHAISSALHN